MKKASSKETLELARLIQRVSKLTVDAEAVSLAGLMEQHYSKTVEANQQVLHRIGSLAITLDDLRSQVRDLEERLDRVFK